MWLNLNTGYSLSVDTESLFSSDFCSSFLLHFHWLITNYHQKTKLFRCNIEWCFGLYKWTFFLVCAYEYVCCLSICLLECLCIQTRLIAFDWLIMVRSWCTTVASASWIVNSFGFSEKSTNIIHKWIIINSEIGISEPTELYEVDKIFRPHTHTHKHAQSKRNK